MALGAHKKTETSPGLTNCEEIKKSFFESRSLSQTINFLLLHKILICASVRGSFRVISEESE